MRNESAGGNRAGPAATEVTRARQARGNVPGGGRRDNLRSASVASRRSAFSGVGRSRTGPPVRELRSRKRVLVEVEQLPGRCRRRGRAPPLCWGFGGRSVAYW